MLERKRHYAAPQYQVISKTTKLHDINLL